ncbi:Exonuclease 3'-5' domain-containing protein 1, partial [Ophiophagus hannah]
MDTSSDYHFLHRVLGKTLHITLKCGTFQGILQHVDSSQCIFLNRDEDSGEDIEYIVINQFQKTFGSAMMHIKNQRVCSIAAEGVHLCRHGKLSWVQVIHDCRWLSDCLFHQYGIVLSNVFDTQVADVLRFSMETGGYLPHRISTLQECLMRYLRLPDKCISFLESKEQVMEEDPEVWFVRPLPPVLLNILALETVYLLRLRLLLFDEIMSDLTTLVDSYLNAFRQGSADPLGSIKISSMELPEELRQLADLYNIRRKTAVQKFQFNEEGFLIRGMGAIRRKKAENEPYPKTYCPGSDRQGNYKKEEIDNHVSLLKELDPAVEFIRFGPVQVNRWLKFWLAPSRSPPTPRFGSQETTKRGMRGFQER